MTDPGGAYCDNRSKRKGKDVLTLGFKGPKIVVIHGGSTQGGKALVYVDGERQGRLSFRSGSRTIDFGQRKGFRDLGTGDHTLRIVMVHKTGYVEGFIT